MKIRHAIAVMVSRFPLITETFILRELIELERQGQPVLLVPMLRENPKVVHEEAKPWVERALYTPYLSAAILRSNARMLAGRPVRYLTLAMRLLFGGLGSGGFFVRTLAVFPKTVYLAEQLESRGIRHVHAHFATHPATMALIVSRLTGITFSITAHAHDIFVDRALLRIKMRAAAFVRAISKFNRDFLARLYPEVSPKLAVIHVGVPGPESRVPSPHAYHPGAGTRHPGVILCIAALKPYKGVPVLIEALAELVSSRRDVNCEIIGDGPLRKEIEQSIGAGNLSHHVRLIGNLPQHEVAERVARSAMVVLPSIVAPDGQMEGIPVALMEAMAAEKPVVASRLSGIPELVEDNVTGLLVEPGDSRGLAAAIAAILDDPQRAAEMGRRGAETVRRDFALTTTVEQLLRNLDQVNPPPQLKPEEIQLLKTLDPSTQGTGPVGIRQIHDRPDSRVVELLIGGRDLILKTQKSRPGESRPPIERARHEFEILERLGANRCGAPRALRLDGPTIVMESARGKPLDALIRERRGRPAELVAAFNAAGRWLREFQNTIPGAYHGDFWPGNVFVSDSGSVEVIDFEGCRAGEPTRDVEDFLTYTRSFFRRHRGFSTLRDAFLSGYRERGTRDPGPGTRHPNR